MDASHGLILFLMLNFFSNLVFAIDFEVPGGMISSISISIKSECKEIKMPVTYSGIASSYPGCGFRKPKISGSQNGGAELMVGGVETKKYSWPWMVAIYATGEDDWKTRKPLHCGASLISRKYALTAAHCFYGEEERVITDPSEWSVVVGEHYLSEGTKCLVRRILIHPNYIHDGHYNDITLIEFKIPVELSKKVYPVCLPSAGLTDKIEASRSEVVATGWGQMSHGGVYSQVLQEIKVTPVPLEECRKFWNVTEKQLCADGTAKGQAPCMGDSGGPMVYRLEDNSYAQVGIISHGTVCATPGWPSIYTRVSEYTKWIYDNSDLGK